MRETTRWVACDPQERRGIPFADPFERHKGGDVGTGRHWYGGCGVAVLLTPSLPPLPAGGGGEGRGRPAARGPSPLLWWRNGRAGKEPKGYMLSASSPILSNTPALLPPPSVGTRGAVPPAGGRSAPGCKTCHFDQWFA